MRKSVEKSAQNLFFTAGKNRTVKKFAVSDEKIQK